MGRVEGCSIINDLHHLDPQVESSLLLTATGHEGILSSHLQNLGLACHLRHSVAGAVALPIVLQFGGGCGWEAALEMHLMFHEADSPVLLHIVDENAEMAVPTAVLIMQGLDEKTDATSLRLHRLVRKLE